MKHRRLFLLLLVFVAIGTITSLHAPHHLPAVTCRQDRNCRLPLCRCSNTREPIFSGKDVAPQIVSVVFEGALNNKHFYDILNVFKGAKHMNGIPMTGTIFVNAQETNFTQLEHLHKKHSFEIGLYGASSVPVRAQFGQYLPAAKWRRLLREHRQQIADRTNISIHHIKGFRHNQPETNEYIYQALQSEGFSYDSSGEIRGNITHKLLGKINQWPFSLERGWGQVCLNKHCPIGNYSGVWEIPKVSFNNVFNGRQCEYVSSCPGLTKSMDIARALADNFVTAYRGPRTPMVITIKMTSGYTANYYKGLKMFIRGLMDRPDIFLLSLRDLLAWVKHPTPVKHLHSLPHWWRKALLKPVLKQVKHSVVHAQDGFPTPPKPIQSTQPQTILDSEQPAMVRMYVLKMLMAKIDQLRTKLQNLPATPDAIAQYDQVISQIQEARGALDALRKNDLSITSLGNDPPVTKAATPEDALHLLMSEVTAARQQLSQANDPVSLKLAVSNYRTIIDKVKAARAQAALAKAQQPPPAHVDPPVQLDPVKENLKNKYIVLKNDLARAKDVLFKSKTFSGYDPASITEYKRLLRETSIAKSAWQTYQPNTLPVSPNTAFRQAPIPAVPQLPPPLPIDLASLPVVNTLQLSGSRHNSQIPQLNTPQLNGPALPGSGIKPVTIADIQKLIGMLQNVKGNTPKSVRLRVMIKLLITKMRARLLQGTAQPVNKLPVETIPANTQPADILPANISPADFLPPDILPADFLPPDILPQDILPADIPPADILPGDILPADILPADLSPVDIPLDTQTTGAPFYDQLSPPDASPLNTSIDGAQTEPFQQPDVYDYPFPMFSLGGTMPLIGDMLSPNYDQPLQDPPPKQEPAPKQPTFRQSVKSVGFRDSAKPDIALPMKTSLFELSNTGVAHGAPHNNIGIMPLHKSHGHKSHHHKSHHKTTKGPWYNILANSISKLTNPFGHPSKSGSSTKPYHHKSSRKGVLDNMSWLHGSAPYRRKDAPRLPHSDRTLDLPMSKYNPKTCPTGCCLPVCRAMTTGTPGGLSPANVPQMIVLMIHGRLYQRIFDILSDIFSVRENPNGCPISMTYFVSGVSMSHGLIKRLHMQGVEIGVNTLTSTAGNRHFWDRISKTNLRSEIVRMRESLATRTGIPVREIVGFRMPHLHPVGEDQYNILQSTDFLYDSSIVVRKPALKSESLWPFTLHNGWPTTCAQGRCPFHSYPKLWEVPIVDLSQDPNPNPLVSGPAAAVSLSTPKCPFADSCSQKDLLLFFMKHFRDRHTGSREPLYLNFDDSWIIKPDHVTVLKLFIDSLLKNKDVYFVSAKQAIDWVREPKSLVHIKRSGWAC